LQTPSEPIYGPISHTSGTAIEKGVRDHLRDRALPNPIEELRRLLTCSRNESLTLEINRLNTEMAALDAGSPEQIEISKRREVLKARRRKPIEPLGESAE
jgi:hypothetical protein